MKKILTWLYKSKGFRRETAIVLSALIVAFLLKVKIEIYVFICIYYIWMCIYYINYFARYYYKHYYKPNKERLENESALEAYARLNNIDLTEYKIYTTEFDKTVSAKDAKNLIVPIHNLNALANTNEASYIDNKNNYISFQKMEETSNNIVNSLKYSDLKNTVISVVIDHSGSMRGKPSLTTIAYLEQLSQLLTSLNITTEFLGFTTLSWKGGQSRAKWIADGKPYFPGRLCDILHIIYKEADENTPVDFSLLLNPHVLKENIDGEALLWANSRLQARPENFKLVILVSDGAPVDDSTLSANHGSILINHLKKTIDEILELKNTHLCAVSIGFPYYISNLESHTLLEIQDIQSALSEFFPQQLAKLYHKEA